MTGRAACCRGAVPLLAAAALFTPVPPPAGRTVPLRRVGHHLYHGPVSHLDHLSSILLALCIAVLATAAAILVVRDLSGRSSGDARQPGLPFGHRGRRGGPRATHGSRSPGPVAPTFPAGRGGPPGTPVGGAATTRPGHVAPRSGHRPPRSPGYAPRSPLRVVRPRPGVREAFRPAVLHAVLEPRGLVELDGIVYPALWSTEGPAPGLGQPVLVGDAYPEDVFRALPPAPALGATIPVIRPAPVAGAGESGIDVAIEVFPPDAVAAPGPPRTQGQPASSHHPGRTEQR